MDCFKEKEERITRFENFLYDMERNQKLMKEIAYSQENTFVYNDFDKKKKDVNGYTSKIVVAVQDVLETARCLLKKYPNSRIAMVNFINGCNPGGEVIRGGENFEADLCRGSTLYPCLNTRKLLYDFYRLRKKNKEMNKEEACIFIPKIVFMKGKLKEDNILDEKDWFQLDMINCVKSKEELAGLKVVSDSRENGNAIKLTQGIHSIENVMQGAMQVAMKQDEDIVIIPNFTNFRVAY